MGVAATGETARTLTAPGRPHLAIETTTAGEPVLAISGWTISSAIFRPFAGALPDGMRPILYDHRGAGRSGSWYGPVSMALLAADASRVLDACGVESAHVVGVSLGAAVALELAVRMPWRVRSLALVGGWAGGPLAATPALRPAAAVVGAVLRDTLAHRRLWPAAALFSREFLAESSPETVAAAVRPFLAGRASTWVAWNQAIAASCFNRQASLANLRCPTLVAHGDQDAMSPVENAYRMAAAIPGARLEVVAGGHAFPFESPATTASMFRSWLDDVAAAEPATAATVGRVVRERATRPFALHAGALRNARDLPLRLSGHPR